tara:strand:- start:556 stop:753 length:198 start_codon:yes stop_codon:yes gene_type:complete
MADVQIEMADIQAVANRNPLFAQEVKLEAAQRRIDELEAEKAAAPACDCQKDVSSLDEPENVISG